MASHVKHKHVLFAEHAGPSHDPSPDPRTGSAPVMSAHEAGKQKMKTAAKQRYLKKKSKRRKVLEAARKASKPKSRRPVAEATTPKSPESESLDRDGRESSEDDDSVKQPDLTMDQVATMPVPERPVNGTKRKRGQSPDGVPPIASTARSSSPSSSPSGSSSTSSRDQASSRRSSVSALEPFPLPTAPAAPDAPTLARQGLPAGLQDAIFVDQARRLSLQEMGSENGRSISADICQHLEREGVTEFFAVQAAMIPRLLDENLIPHPRIPPRDFLVSAPTGSGKTLAYAIPLLEVLSRRKVVRLRGLIVLPTKELVLQVRETLDALAKGTDLKISIATGHQSLSYEQRQIINDREQRLIGGSSKIDILIATPGRLIDHLEQTPNFTLQHLRFLVVDEADRLLNQSYQGWLSVVLSHIEPPTQLVHLNRPLLPWDHLAPSWLEAYGLTDRSDPLRERHVSACQKLLFSATLTRDPSQAAALSLRSPQYVIIQSSSHKQDMALIGEQFALPSELSEKLVIVEAPLKPITLLHLLHSSNHAIRNALIFTKSVESVERLQRLISYFQDAWPGQKITAESYTADIGASDRRALLKRFEKGIVHVLICSDLVARGVDLPSVEHVVSYDVPLDMRKYVHRVGRTARAGRSGTAWTLVEKQEAPRFRAVLQDAQHASRLVRVRPKVAELDVYRDSYEIAIKRLAAHYKHSR